MQPRWHLHFVIFVFILNVFMYECNDDEKRDRMIK